MARNEIGLNLLGWVYFNYDPVYPHPAYCQLSIVNGITYTRRIRKSALRFGVDVFRNRFEAGRGASSNPGFFSATGSAVRTDLRLSFEHQFTSSPVRPYAAINLVARHERLRLDGEGWGDLAWQQVPEPYAYHISSMRYGPAVSIGMSWRLSKRFSCSIEGDVWFVLIGDDDVPYSARSTVYFDVLRSFSINYHWF